MSPKISIIIPCYNYGRYLIDAVESVIHQSLQDFEIIIVNDGSTDETREVAESLIAKYPRYAIQLINQTNSGQPAIARNRGIEKSKGEYILCLDADDKIALTMLEECSHILRNNPNISIAYTDRLDFDGIEKVVLAKDYDFERLKFENHISYCAMYRRIVWEKVGGYRLNLLGSEDWDFWVAAGEKGFWGFRIPKPLFHYRRHDTGRFQFSKLNLKTIHAQIIINNSKVYSLDDIKNADRILAMAAVWRSSTQPTVSIILPTYNRLNQLSRSIRSVLEQSFNNFEIVVVNDGGVDVSEVINDLNKDGNIIHLLHDLNRGPSAARNTGIRAARGKYIAYLDDDDIFYPDHLHTLVNLLETTEYRFAYTDAYHVTYDIFNEQLIQRGKEKFISGDFDPDRILVENFIPLLCVMHERTCLDEVGMFDEALISHEDWDLWIRMAQKYSIGHIQKITCEFTSINNDVRESERRAEFLSTLLIIYEKYKNEISQKPNILEAQKNKFAQALQWSYDHIKGLETEKRNLQENLKQLNKTLHSIQAKLTAIQENLSWRILNRYMFHFWDKWVIPFGSKRRVFLERFFRRNIKFSEIKPPQSLSQFVVIKNRIIKKASKISDIKKIILYTNSNGNYFFNEIRDLIAAGIRELGYDVNVKNEKDWLCDDDAWHIVVAPHEFFYLGQHAASESEILPENLILVNTEQPSTQWYSLAENYFPTARFIWDINYDSSDRIKENGFDCNFLPLGFAADCYLFQEVKQLSENYGTCFLNKEIKENSYLNMPFVSRPLDISFVGCLTPRREEFFVKAAAVTSNYRSYIHFSDGLSAPVIPGITTHMNTETVVGLMQRSKIMLNIHHGSDHYFEWHRIVILGIGQKTLVISEPSISSPIFQPGIHYVEAKLKDIPEKIKYYLSNPRGIKEAQKIIETGYERLTKDCRINDSLRPLISKLDIKI